MDVGIAAFIARETTIGAVEPGRSRQGNLATAGRIAFFFFNAAVKPYIAPLLLEPRCTPDCDQRNSGCKIRHEQGVALI